VPLTGSCKRRRSCCKSSFFSTKSIFRGFDDQEIRALIAEKEVLVGARHFLNVLCRNLALLVRLLFGNAAKQHFRLGLEINHQIGLREFDRERFVIALVKLELLVIQAQVREDAGLFPSRNRSRQGRAHRRKGLHECASAVPSGIQLRAESGPGKAGIEISQKGIIFAIVNAARVKPFGEQPSQRGLANT